MPYSEIAERIRQFIRRDAYRPLLAKELARALDIRQTPTLMSALAELEAGGDIVRTRTDRYGPPEKMNLLVGRFEAHPKGFAFLVPDDPTREDVYIGRENTGGAMHGDRVIARLAHQARGQRRLEGEVIRVLQRANTHIVGTYRSARLAGFVEPDERRIGDDIFVPPGANAAQASDGDKVVVEVVSWPSSHRSAEGRVVEVIGKLGDPGVDITSIIRKHGLPEAFPEEVLAEADRIPSAVEPADLKGRRDLRSELIVTIDGEDAKDLDDAIHVIRTENGWRLGVHIADVTYYVREGSALDEDARRRGTSVYLADRVVPMLPHRLSNGICSLNPQVDRLTLSIIMDVDSGGRVVRHELVPSVIRTAERMTYSAVAALLAGEPGSAFEVGKGSGPVLSATELRARYSRVLPMLEQAAELAEVLRRRRLRRGAIDFDFPEAKIVLDAEGRPVDIKRRPRTQADRMIEEFMLLANETVAEEFERRELPLLYRVHEEPDSERIENLAEFAAHFGYLLKGLRKVRPKDLQDLLSQVAGQAEEGVIATVVLRAMKQARYSDQPLGHFGLATEHYCHFTSPIRRYPDLIVHRIVRESIERRLTPKRQSDWIRLLPELATHTSARERAAVEAEREVDDLKKAEFMRDKVGEKYDAIISGVTGFGFFVQLPNTVEGLVHVSTLGDDYYHFHEKAYALIGERTKRTFRLGDEVRVVVTSVSLGERQINFELVPTEGGALRGRDWADKRGKRKR